MVEFAKYPKRQSKWDLWHSIYSSELCAKDGDESVRQKISSEYERLGGDGNHGTFQNACILEECFRRHYPGYDAILEREALLDAADRIENGADEYEMTMKGQELWASIRTNSEN